MSNYDAFVEGYCEEGTSHSSHHFRRHSTNCTTTVHSPNSAPLCDVETIQVISPGKDNTVRIDNRIE